MLSAKNKTTENMKEKGEFKKKQVTYISTLIF